MTMSTLDWFVRLAHQNAWANHRLANAIAQLDDAAYMLATRTSFFPSIHLTLAHILYVDLFYLDALEHGGAGRRVYDDEDRCARDGTFAEVRERQAATDRRLAAFTAKAELGAPVSLDFRAGTVTETAGDVLMHVFQHSIHHRGQVHAMLAGTGVAPPQLDEFFLQVDLPRRAAELAELGLPPR
jgi:uncharacterized damage-inducible protein DinB